MSAATSPSAGTDDDLRELYRELILDHARSPRHFGSLASATHCVEGVNPLCGDRLTLYLDVDERRRIRKAGFEGSGCAISVASASLLTEIVSGMREDEAMHLFHVLTERLTGRSEEPGEPALDLGKLPALEGVREFPSRVKCATLAWHAMRSALAGDRLKVTTE